MSDLASIHYSARRRAAKIITACYDGQHVAHDLLDAQQADEPLSSSDAALTTELVIGVLRHLITCEHIAARYYRGRWIGLRANLRVTAALGIYQLCWLDRIPDHAAVDQSVQLAKFHGKGAAATVNAILRKVIEIRGNIVEQSQSHPPRRYMLIDETRARLFDDDVFPDPARKPLDHIVAATGHPMWLVERWHRRFKPALCRQICEAGSLRPKLVLRANTRRITAAALLKQLCDAGHEAQFIEGTEAITVR
jgi:16S rRNA (cytosine967-C5)-methyltransferase